LLRLDAPLPAQGMDAQQTLAMLDELVSPATMAMAGPRFFGFVIGGSLPAALAANWLAAAWDQNCGYYSITPGVARLEDSALRRLVALFELPAHTAAGFVTGATVANFTALAAARHAVLERVGWNVEADGLFGAPQITVIAGEEAHPTLLKSLGMLGLGRSRIVRVPVDGQGRMRPDELPPIAGPTMSAGRQRQHRRLRSVRPADRARPWRRRVGACRWCLRFVGQGHRVAAAPGAGAGSRRFLGH
jgi:glutamate/tyrosine decarboxylase-like PLP-dependent enzyme